LAIIGTALAVAVAGSAAAPVTAVPVLLLVVASGEARVSTARTRPRFSSRDEWRDAERRAVAAALGFGRRR
jgi:hypothetical protein